MSKKSHLDWHRGTILGICNFFNHLDWLMGSNIRYYCVPGDCYHN